MLQMHDSTSSINQIESTTINNTSSNVNNTSSIHQDSLDRINAVRSDLRRFSYISTDTSSNGDDIESALFNDENLFRTNTNSDNTNSNSNRNGSNNFNISSTFNSNSSTTSSTNRFNLYNLKSPQKVHTRPSMKMIPEDNSLFRSKSNRYTYTNNQNSKLSLVSSLADITNLSSNISPSRNNLSRRTSNFSNQSYQARRNYSLTENGSIISMEQKRSQIIQKLNKRNSKNISNPYFYQYKGKHQPAQAPPDAPEFDQDSYYNNHDVINMSNYNNLITPTSETFSDFNSTDESLHFVDRSNVNSPMDIGRQVTGISEATSNFQSQRNYTSTNGADSNNNTESTSNNTSYNTANTNNNNNTNNTNNNTSNNSGNTSSHYSSHHSRNNGKSDQGNTSSDSNNTKDTGESSDTTTASDENGLSRRIRDSQRNSSGLFSELSFLSATAPLVPRAVVDTTIEETGLSNDSNINASKEHVRSSAKKSGSISTVSTTNLNLDQFVVVNPSRSQQILPFPLSMNNTSNSIQDSGITNPGPVLTIKNIGSHDSPDSNESKLRKFSLANDSSISVLHTNNNSLLEKPLSDSSSITSKNKDKFLNPPSVTSPIPGATSVVPIQSAIKSFVASSNGSISSHSKKAHAQESNDEVPAIPTFPTTLYSSSSLKKKQIKSDSSNQQISHTQTGGFTRTSDNPSSDGSTNSNNINESNGSRENLLKNEKKKSKLLPFKLVPSNRFSGKAKTPFELDLEKGTDLNEDYTEIYHYYEYNDRCGDMISILFILISLLAPPFWLLIGLGYLDKSFGKIDKKYKITSIVLFSIFCVGAILGIAIGFGYGLTHRR